MNFQKAVAVLIFSACSVGFQQSGVAAESFKLNLTNGTNMPLSAGVVYAVEGQSSISAIGNAPSPGLIKLCQMGDPSQKFTELKQNANVTWVAETPAAAPGTSVSVNVTVPNARKQSLHFEGMYGESKELCASINIGSQQLTQLWSQHQIQGTDLVINAGASTEPSLPSDFGPTLCQGAANAVDCLRTLATPRASSLQIHSFAGYLPSVLNFLENKYGSADVLTLFVPQNGGINYSLQRQ